MDSAKVSGNLALRWFAQTSQIVAGHYSDLTWSLVVITGTGRHRAIRNALCLRSPAAPHRMTNVALVGPLRQETGDDRAGRGRRQAIEPARPRW
jgi:hypothetical protein